ncbi:hypothetical protein ACH47X_00865 [Promicromonospora kroppenstedtii]|uniref:Secreted protein n=1 Tax=Promicromonospora kroppenstedtii TaxID=440482 RepID=A0ABW7XD66_9MICO
MQIRKMIAMIGTSAALIVGMGVTGAQAASVDYRGSQATNTGSATNYIHSKDTACNGLFTSAWGKSVSTQHGDVTGSTVNKNGCGTSTSNAVTTSPRNITHIRSCEAQGGVLPMSCSAYKSTGLPAIDAE